MFKLEITHTEGAARTGRLMTARGDIATPAFMTVSTLGATKGLTLDQVNAAGAEVILMNAFHLAWRPGEALIKDLGGLHRFTGWQKPILTDSGGYQIFSLPGLRKITEEGAHFSSPVNGELRLFSPETVVELEAALGADMVMPLDHCPSHTNTPAEIEAAVERSIRWAERSRKRWRELNPPNVNLFGIIQGACDEKLRTRSVEATCALDLPGYALGGFCVGEANADTRRGIAYSAPLLPADRPRYLMGMGSPQDILHSVASGVDLFDCTLPTRNGRNASVFTSGGRLNLRNARFARDESPLDASCACYTCRTHSRAYLRHLFLAREMNAAILTSLHNVAFYLNLMRELRAAIAAGRFASFKRECEEKLAREDAAPDEGADTER